MHLTPKAFQLLELLIASRPRALSKPELQDRLWPQTLVSRSSLGRLMSELRAALGEDARFVRTLHGFGYAFRAQLEVPNEAASVERPRGEIVSRLLWGAREIELREGVNLLGRVSGCNVWLEAPGVSRRHAQIVVTQGGATIEDLGSKNGTSVRGRKIHAATALADGDEIAIGTAVMTFRLSESARSTETLSR